MKPQNEDKSSKWNVVLVGVVGICCICGMGCQYDRTELFRAKPWLSAENAVEIYAVWYEKDPQRDLSSVKDAWLVFQDLDLDGVCEMILSVCEGSGNFENSTVYQIDPKSRLVKEMPVALGEHDRCVPSCAFDSSVRMMRDRLSGEIEYLVTESAHDLRFTLDGLVRVRMKDGALQYDSLLSVCREVVDGHEELIVTYLWQGTKVDKNVYDRLWRMYQERHQELGVNVGVMSSEDLRLKGRSLRERMLKTYQQFTLVEIVCEGGGMRNKWMMAAFAFAVLTVVAFVALGIVWSKWRDCRFELELLQVQQSAEKID